MARACPGIALREAGALDVPLIAAMHAECFADGAGGGVWDEAAIAAILSLPGSYGLLAAVAAEHGPGVGAMVPAGFVLARTLVGEAEILSLGVSVGWRRRGAARALLHAAMRRARKAGARRTLLEVAEDNLAARALYAGEGFVMVNRRPSYYRRSGAPAAAALVFARAVPR